jgi:hypothetical protein
MKREARFTHGRRMPFLIAICLSMMLGVNLRAQTFQGVYGTTCVEAGYKGVAEVTGCSGGGFISVGMTFATTATSGCTTSPDAYIVRTDLTGKTIWERKVNIFGAAGASNDTAVSVKEIPNGFIVTGVTKNPVNGKEAIFLLKLNCDGNVIWCRTYKCNINSNEAARDIIVAKQGNNTTTKVGDYILCGWTDGSGSGNVDGLILRTDTSGIVVWGEAYDPGHGGNDQFFGLIETQFGTSPGDVVAVGGTLSYPALGEQGWVVRANGNTGQVGGTPQGSANFGLFGDERFFSVKELSNGTNASNLVYVGYTLPNALPVGQEDMFVAKTTQDPCTQIATRTLGDVNRDMAYDIVEILNPNDFVVSRQTSVHVGDLAVVGAANHGSGPFSVITDAFLVTLNVGSLAQTGSGFLYGDGVMTPASVNNFNDGPASVWELNSGTHHGFIMCGYTQSNFRGSTPADPQDMYLIRTDPPNSSNEPCNRIWTMTHSGDTTWSPECETPVVRSILARQNMTPTSAAGWTETLFCTCATCGLNKLIQHPQGEEIAEGGIAAYYPNPLKEGTPMKLEYDAAHDGALRVTVTDAAGGQVREFMMNVEKGRREIMIETSGLAAGTYMVGVNDRGWTHAVRMIVVP